MPVPRVMSFIILAHDVQLDTKLKTACNRQEQYVMSKTVQIASKAQFEALLKSSKVVVADCELHYPSRQRSSA